MIITKKLTRAFPIGKETFKALDGVSLEVKKGEFVAIMGPSGSGKSTLLQLIGGLELPTEGEVIIDDISMNSLTERERTLYRRRNIGFIFQNYQLLPSLTVEENIAFPLDADRVSTIEINTRVAKLIKEVGLEGKEKVFPNVMSGGQQQRVAIARALSTNPRLILADEPTGNLDRKKGTDILKLLSRLHKEEHLTIIMVTHDIFAAGYADRVVMLKDGKIESEVIREEAGKDEIMANFLAQLDG
ncbi:ABC transporter ATP-binding protein [Bacillus aquiflavi]|uniref:ABC transporter ATP-binding protein n=1 Tax=Bacillus aquiflavi TaxID=2672567 RepID=A0A6B3W0J8_9BACI|nr:ABC transporter ATP-binding protein [Bacillus aquiflavi]MBA4537859.1 ABC transporter ATP-binding protein [Bacillus aquiflavi]NEY82115.1 ABC transporter ATP-binding protein [Bacillus aquiflavi]UAC48439.1 ABC transporter ATP-binding protein [Bacillus aquiflavi]